LLQFINSRGQFPSTIKRWFLCHPPTEMNLI
jgi:hypothetical protein